MPKLSHYIANITYTISLIPSGLHNSPENLNLRRRWFMGLIMRKYGYLSIPNIPVGCACLGSARASSLPLVGLLGGWGLREMKIQLFSWILYKPFQSTPNKRQRLGLTSKTSPQVHLQDFFFSLNQPIRLRVHHTGSI